MCTGRDPGDAPRALQHGEAREPGRGAADVVEPGENPGGDS